MINKEFINIILKGIERGDQIGGPFELAKILSQSIGANNGFNKDDLRSKYLSWWKEGAFDTGPTYASVFTKIDNGMQPSLAVKKYTKNLGLAQQVVAQLTVLHR